MIQCRCQQRDKGRLKLISYHSSLQSKSHDVDTNVPEATSGPSKAMSDSPNERLLVLELSLRDAPCADEDMEESRSSASPLNI